MAGKHVQLILPFQQETNHPKKRGSVRRTVIVPFPWTRCQFICCPELETHTHTHTEHSRLIMRFAWGDPLRLLPGMLPLPLFSRIFDYTIKSALATSKHSCTCTLALFELHCNIFGFSFFGKENKGGKH